MAAVISGLNTISQPQHGGDLQRAMAHYGSGDWIDCSSGIAPWAYPLPAVPEAVWQRLPDQDDALLQLLYSAADVMVVPSRQESFGQTASEALACGLPVAAFASTGLVDVVDHKVTGYLAKPFDTEELAFGIQWILENQQDSAKLRYASRQRAVDLFSYPVIAKQYQAVYQQAIDQNADSN